MDLIFNEDTKQFELAKQPYKTVEIRCETEEDYNDFEKILNLSQPRKPIESDEQVIRYVQTYECPNCGKAFTGKGILNYCYYCGQKLVHGKIKRLRGLKEDWRMKINDT